MAPAHGLQPQFSGGQGEGGPQLAANAGVLILVRTGAVQAIAAPAPIRLSIFRREIPSLVASSSGVISPSFPQAIERSRTSSYLVVRGPLPLFLPTQDGGGQGVGAHVN